MQSDSVARALLALILLCLLVLVVQSFADDDDPFGAGWGRYQVTGMRAGAPVLIRTDTVTGQAWKLELRGGRNTWVAFQEPEAADGEGGAPEQASREPGERPLDTAGAERDVVEPPQAPPLPEEPPRVSPEVLEALPPPAAATGSRVDEEQQADFAELAEALTKPDLPGDIRAWVAEQLGKNEDPRATEALLGALDDADSAVVAASLRALAGRDDARVRAAAEEARASESEEVRRAADALLDASE